MISIIDIDGASRTATVEAGVQVYNIYLGLTGGGDGITPERPPCASRGRTEYRICFLVDPDGCRVGPIDGPFHTPRDDPRP